MNLYIVATPIGNLQDISLRAGRLLLESEIIIAESTSKAGILLEFLKKEFPNINSVEKQIISLTEDEEDQKIPFIIKLIEQKDAVLISEAGTPLISDPGFKLVRTSIQKGINIIPIPGPTALIAALSASGFPTDKFIFIGYPPKSESKKTKQFEKLRVLFDEELSPTIILYESPHRLLDTLKTIESIFGNINMVIARELTKIHEEIRRESISESIYYFGENTLKGEFVILLNPK